MRTTVGANCQRFFGAQSIIECAPTALTALYRRVDFARVVATRQSVHPGFGSFRYAMIASETGFGSFSAFVMSTSLNPAPMGMVLSEATTSPGTRSGPATCSSRLNAASPGSSRPFSLVTACRLLSSSEPTMRYAGKSAAAFAMPPPPIVRTSILHPTALTGTAP